MRTLALLPLLLGVLVAEAQARTLYVNNVAGSDLLNGQAPEVLGPRLGPVQTVTKALRIAGKGDQIVIANTGVPYRECLTVQGGDNSGFEGQPFLIQGNGAVLDGSLPIPPNAWEHYAGPVYRYRPANLNHHQLFLDGKPIPRKPANELTLALPELEPLEWALWQGHVYFRVEPERVPDSYPLTQTAERAGFTLYRVRNVVISNLTIQGFSLDGVHVHDGFGPVVLDHLTCRGNGRSGIAVVGATRARIQHCLLAENAVAQLLLQGLTETYVVNSRLVEDWSPPLLYEGGALYIDGKPIEHPLP